jgi:single-strand DNA-binding protein
MIKRGSFKMFASGAVVKKNFGTGEHGSFLYATLVRSEEDQHGKRDYYLKIRLRGKQAEFFNEYINLGDSVICSGEMVSERNKTTGFSDYVLRVNEIETHNLPSKTTMDRIQSAYAAKQQQQGQGNTPQQQMAQPQQQTPQAQQEPPMDFDDDIPF